MGKGVIGVAILAALGVAKHIPNDKVKSFLTPILYKAGVIVTLGMSKSPVTKPVWNKVVEPYVIDLIENVNHSIKEGFIPGLRSDNDESEENI